MSRHGLLIKALRVYPSGWRQRYEHEILDLADELLTQTGTTERRVALGLLLSAPRAWFLQLRRANRRAIVSVVVALTAMGAGIIAIVVPATPAAGAPFRIASGAMEPALKVNEVVQVTPLSSSSRIVPGEIVVFRRPPALNCGAPSGLSLVKRVVGLPGQTISASGGYVSVNGKRLHESWLPASEQGSTFPGPRGPYGLVHRYTVPAHSFYVLGDNRTDSCDSRYWGPVSSALLYGSVNSPTR
jgi:signal peptidase I